MLGTFCLRLACGLACSLLVLSPKQVNQRFYRVHFLTVLGLLALGGVARGFADPALLTALACAFFGSLIWSLDEAPGGRLLMGLVALATVVVLALQTHALPPEGIESVGLGWRLADDLTSALLLGAAMTAMLMGHSYLIAPAMSLTPLFRLLALLLMATVLRMALAGAGLWSWTAGHSLGNLEDETVLWLPLRWGLGFAAPLALSWMAWQTTRIRSTQSATGILYVVVIFCFLGELTSQLLVRNTGFIL
jgi:hypothetical protein